MKKRKKQRKNETKRIWLERQKERMKDRKKDRKKQRKTERKTEIKDHIRRQDLAALNKTRHVLAKPSQAQQEATRSHFIRGFANWGGLRPPPTTPLICKSYQEVALCRPIRCFADGGGF